MLGILSTSFFVKGYPLKGSKMVLLGRTMACSYGLSIKTTVSVVGLSGTVWPQSAMLFLVRVASPKCGKK